MDTRYLPHSLRSRRTCVSRMDVTLIYLFWCVGVSGVGIGQFGYGDRSVRWVRPCCVSSMWLLEVVRYGWVVQGALVSESTSEEQPATLKPVCQTSMLKNQRKSILRTRVTDANIPHWRDLFQKSVRYDPNHCLRE